MGAVRRHDLRTPARYDLARYDLARRDRRPGAARTCWDEATCCGGQEPASWHRPRSVHVNHCRPRKLASCSQPPMTKPRDALWALLLMLGLRRSEACALTWCDVDFLAGTPRISRSVQRVDGQLRELPTKTRRSNCTVPLPARCLHALAEHHRRLQEVHAAGHGSPWPPTGYVFGTRWGTPLEPRNLSRMWGKLCDDLGDPLCPAARSPPHVRPCQSVEPARRTEPARRRAVRIGPLLSPVGISDGLDD